MSEMPTIQTIFRKNKNGEYTRDALLYHDILRYSVNELKPTEGNLSFKIWELTEWLISHNLEFVSDYGSPSSRHFTKSNKVESRIGRVRRHVSMLLYLGLIEEYRKVKATKGQGLTTEYRYTEFGLLISLLIMVLRSETRNKAINYIYQLCRKNFEKNPSSSLDTFCLLFFDKLYKNNLFESYVDTLIETLSKQVIIADMNGFFESSMTLDLNEEDSKKVVEFKIEAFNELNPDMKKYFMHRRKLEIERKMFGASDDLRGFEKLSFRLRNDFEKIVAQGYCASCGLYFTVAFSIIEYIGQSYDVDEITSLCPECKKEKALTIPLFRL
jgi:hypothetical protein